MAFAHVPPQEPRGKAEIVFVGEAPSDEEVSQGRPLVGPAGRIFNAMLRTAGLDRAEFGVTNVFDEQLPGNSIKPWTMPMAEALAAGLTDLPPIEGGFLRPEHRGHLERLRKELERWQPTVIVPLGGTALWALTGHSGITAMRGSASVATRLLPGVKIVPTFHPAAIMRQWKFFHVVVGDFIRAEEEAKLGPQLILPKRELLLEPTLEDLEQWRPELLASDLLSVDIETGWRQITCIGFAPSAERAICVPFFDLRVANRSYWPTPDAEVEAWAFVRAILGSATPKLGQNFAQYDAYWLLRGKQCPVRNLLHDTRLIHHALYPELPKGLEFMGNSYARQGVWKSWGRGEKNDD